MSGSHYLELIRYYRWQIAALFVLLVGGVAILSAFFLFITPVYTATAKISLLPTQSELAFTQNFVRSSSVNPANLMSQTHIENLVSRELARKTIDRLAEQSPSGSDTPAGSPAPGGLKAIVTERFRALRNTIRRWYNILNSGKHVPIPAYTDAVLTLQDSIDVEMIEGTYILEVSVSWNRPDVAAAACNILTEVYLERARAQADEASRAIEADLRERIRSGDGSFTDLEDQINALQLARAGSVDLLRVIDPAVEPIYPSFPKVVLNTLLAIAGAILLSAFAVVAADTFSATIKTSADLERAVPGHMIPAIRARRGRPRGRWRRGLAGIARRLGIHGAGEPGQGAVMAMGSNDDSRAACRVIEAALTKGIGAGCPEPFPRLRNLGGATENAAVTDNVAPDWLVIALRPGTVTESELEDAVAEWKRRGVRQVFAMILKR